MSNPRYSSHEIDISAFHIITNSTRLTQITLYISLTPSHPHTLTDLDLEDLFLRLAREARAARPRPFPRDCFLVGVVRGVAGERGAVLSTLVLVVIGESGEEEMVGVC